MSLSGDPNVLCHRSVSPIDALLQPSLPSLLLACINQHLAPNIWNKELHGLYKAMYSCVDSQGSMGFPIFRLVVPLVGGCSSSLLPPVGSPAEGTSDCGCEGNSCTSHPESAPQKVCTKIKSAREKKRKVVQGNPNLDGGAPFVVPWWWWLGVGYWSPLNSSSKAKLSLVFIQSHSVGESTPFPGRIYYRVEVKIVWLLNPTLRTLSYSRLIQCRKKMFKYLCNDVERDGKTNGILFNVHQQEADDIMWAPPCHGILHACSENKQVFVCALQNNLQNRHVAECTYIFVSIQTESRSLQKRGRRCACFHLQPEIFCVFLKERACVTFVIKIYKNISIYIKG